MSEQSGSLSIVLWSKSWIFSWPPVLLSPHQIGFGTQLRYCVLYNTPYSYYTKKGLTRKAMLVLYAAKYSNMVESEVTLRIEFAAVPKSILLVKSEGVV